MNAINKTTGETYRTKFTKSKELEREGVANFVENGDLVLDDAKFNTLKLRGWFAEKINTTPAVRSDWKNEPATNAQLDYLNDLGVNVTRTLTKSEASDVISAAKRGESIGAFGLFFFNGSN